jgi:hypothetical protein
MIKNNEFQFYPSIERNRRIIKKVKELKKRDEDKSYKIDRSV